MRIHLAIILFLLFLAPIQAEQLRIAVAANFYTTLNLIKQEFEKEFNDELVIIKGSTGKLYAQIIHGAPYDIYMAADIKRPVLLEQNNMIVSKSRYTYAKGLLVLWSNNAPDDVLVKLKNNQFNKLAIANPKIAPYGLAATEVLERLKLYNVVKNKLVYGENIAQAFQFVQSGSADLGFIALSYVKAGGKNAWQVPENLYTSLDQQLVILKSSKKQALANKFIQFIKTNKIKTIIQQQGYVI